MSKPIIEVRGLSKKYRLGQIGMGSLREDLAARWRRFRTGGEAPASKRDFWALRDVTFDVQPGEILGIIGKNGAGKSTLLKVLSRITEPTSGHAFMHGRLASLLEVGTGFHPDLTGRENVFLNGTMLGMSRVEVASKLDEIIEFAELTQFIDTPVKRYSSGMYVRLAFAVAAHLEPEILIIDEVLAVGDAAFQRKCLGKMNAVAHENGRTILFVSHNMGAIESLCHKVLLIEGGRIADQGKDIQGLVRRYLAQSNQHDQQPEWINPGAAYDRPYIHINRFALTDAAGRTIQNPVAKKDSVFVRIEGTLRKDVLGLEIGYGLFNNSETLLFWSTNLDGPDSMIPQIPVGDFVLQSEIPGHFLNEGEYHLDLFLGIYRSEWCCEPGVNAPRIRLDIQGGLGESRFWIETRPGIMGPIFPWRRMPGGA